METSGLLDRSSFSRDVVVRSNRSDFKRREAAELADRDTGREQ